ncbi:hypothetical protein [Echinicola jeungdonensis]|uniref:hypothetical protein n=1 Tax=Echinicola jeungdonensis TaxID=709343 RepID=UPI00338D34E9
MNAADSVRPLDAMAEARNAFFKGTLIEGHALMEFHFLDYLAPHSKFRYTPYGFIGFGYALFFGNGRSFEEIPIIHKEVLRKVIPWVPLLFPLV